MSISTFSEALQKALPIPPTTLLDWVLAPRIEFLGVIPLTGGFEEPKSLRLDMLVTRKG